MRRFSLIFLASTCLVLPTRDNGHTKEPQNPAANFVNQSTPAVPTADNDTSPHEYYVDCGTSQPNGDGRSTDAAWHSLEAVNAHTFSPADIIRLKRGTECHGLLWPKGSGAASASIRLSAYGTGDRPRVVANRGDEEAFKLFGQEFWDIDSIDFSGGTVFGVYVSGEAGVLHHIHLRNLLVHDVRGEEVKHKESGLVVISPGKVHQHFDDVLVDGIVAYGTAQWAGILVGGGNFGEVPEEDWSTHVIVRNSVVHDVYGDGIILFRVKDGLIDASAAWHTGMQPTQTIGTPNAIWTWMCSDCVVSNNEAFLTDSPGVDGGAFDIDYGNSRNSVIGNFGHDTQGYCISVFAAGYVTLDSVVEGNLCVNNGRSPRMALYQGAIFLWTWNNGIIENLRVEKNTIYWSPPGNFPALLNRADIRGTQKVFRENEIYSCASAMIESNTNLTLQSNRYVSCENDKTSWTFDGKTYSSFDAYRNATAQDRESHWTSDESSATCLAPELALLKQSATTVVDDKNERVSRANLSSQWSIVSEIPSNLDAQGLLDDAAVRQVVVLKNQWFQYRPSGLRFAITLDVPPGAADDSFRNAVRDISEGSFEILLHPTSGSTPRAKTRLIARGGACLNDWEGFVGPTQLGLALRKIFGVSRYSQLDPLPH
jgi:hypothetical protein